MTTFSNIVSIIIHLIIAMHVLHNFAGIVSDKIHNEIENTNLISLL